MQRWFECRMGSVKCDAEAVQMEDGSLKCDTEVVRMDLRRSRKV